MIDCVDSVFDERIRIPRKGGRFALPSAGRSLRCPLVGDERLAAVSSVENCRDDAQFAVAGFHEEGSDSLAGAAILSHGNCVARAARQRSAGINRAWIS